MQKTHPRAIWLFFAPPLGYLFLIFMIFVMPAITGILFTEGSTSTKFFISTVFLLFTLFIVFLIYLWAKMSYNFYRYELTEDSFRKESGIITKRYVSIPYDKIQNIDIYRGLWARILGLSEIRIETAGSSRIGHTEGRLIGIDCDKAEKLRDELINKSRESKK